VKVASTVRRGVSGKVPMRQLAGCLPYDDLVSNIIDLLTDLMHLCKQQEIEFQGCLLSAEINFESEK
jgi:hypothetical protein